MKINEIIYYCLDAIKAISDDSHVNEDHVLFLLSKYRSVLLQQQYNTKKFNNDANYQIVPLTLDIVKGLSPYKNLLLKSNNKVPSILPIVKPTVLLFNGFESEVIEFVPFVRFKTIGYNKWKQNFIYSAIGNDDYLYVTSTNPQSKYLEDIQVKAVFQDFIAAYDLIYGENDYDIMEQELPLEYPLIPNLIAYVVKDILGTAWRPSDKTNDGDDSLSDIATFVRQNMKKRYNNTIEGEEE